MSKVLIDGLAAAILSHMEQYRNAVTDDLKAQVKTSANDCVKLIQEKSPKDTGAYAKSWKQKTAQESPNSITCVCYAGNGEYRLTHLLENGHAKAGGGRVEAQPHIAPAKQEIEADLQKKVEIICKGSERS